MVLGMEVDVDRLVKGEVVWTGRPVLLVKDSCRSVMLTARGLATWMCDETSRSWLLSRPKNGSEWLS